MRIFCDYISWVITITFMTHYHQLKQQKHSRRSNFDIYMLNMVDTFVNIYFCVRIIDDIYICLYIIIYHMEGIDSDVK